jgi:hypothetical protein
VERLAEGHADPERDDHEERDEDAATPVPPAAKPFSPGGHGLKSIAPRA